LKTLPLIADNEKIGEKMIGEQIFKL